MHVLPYYATASDADEVIIYGDDDYQVTLGDSVFLDGFSGDVTAEELLYSIDSKLTQVNAYTTFGVTIGFALIIVYITLRPIFYFLDI